MFDSASKPMYAPDPDALLVTRVRDGDLRAFEALVKRYHGRIYVLVLRILGNRKEAEDTLQETFISLLNNVDRFRSRSRFSTWVFSIAMNAAKHRLAKSKDFANRKSWENVYLL